VSILSNRLDRREALRAAAGFIVAESFGRVRADDARQTSVGRVEGHLEGAKAGLEILASGGNAADACVTAALVAAVVSPFHCGPGGYGGAAIVATADGKTVAGIDFNSAAPAAARPDMYQLTATGGVKGQESMYGWKAVGVPGTLAGLQRVLDRFGTRKFGDVAAPAIRYARDGFPVVSQIANAKKNDLRLAKDPASAKLYFASGEAPKLGSKLTNPDLAAMLETLAKRGSVESFYRGDIGAKIAAAIQTGGGLVSAADMAAYHALDVEPLSFAWRGLVVRTPPPTAGGATALETLNILKALRWDEWDRASPQSLAAQVEALRLAWDDRLRYFGDPTKVDVPLSRLLGDSHARELADRVQTALRENKPAPAQTDNRPADGTQHLSAVDRDGMMVAITLTHGGYFGAQVTVDGLGLTLGHGMSRFDPHPGRANSIAPGKRPLHNMSPTVVLKDGRPEMILGGRGGRKIPNAVFEVLAQHVGRGDAPKAAVAAPRIHTEGGLKVELEKDWSETAVRQLQATGYTVTRATSAVVSAVWRGPEKGEFGGSSR
jgi:gamma-glutamyltranspeptidase/glutathione hydrolase